LQRSAGRLTTDYNRTTSASTKRCGTSDLRVGSKGARHSMSSPTALAACPLALPVQTVLYYAFSFQWKLPGVFNRHRSDSECRVFAYDHRRRLTTCYRDFAPTSASVPFLTLVRPHETDSPITFALNPTSPTLKTS